MISRLRRLSNTGRKTVSVKFRTRGARDPYWAFLLSTSDATPSRHPEVRCEGMQTHVSPARRPAGVRSCAHEEPQWRRGQQRCAKGCPSPRGEELSGSEVEALVGGLLHGYRNGELHHDSTMARVYTGTLGVSIQIAMGHGPPPMIKGSMPARPARHRRQAACMHPTHPGPVRGTWSARPGSAGSRGWAGGGGVVGRRSRFQVLFRCGR
jgi:hypothetical protein